MTRHARWLILACVAAFAVPDGLVAQYRLRSDAASRWPSSWSPESLSARLEPQVGRLPIYDEAGGVIPYADIEARVDRSGLKGAFWLSLLGAVGGALAGELIRPHGACDRAVGGLYQPCSPREKALHSAWPAGLALVGFTGGAWLGWRDDVTTWQEALAQIRSERRIRGTP